MPSPLATQKSPRFGKMRNTSQVIWSALLAALIALSGVVYFSIDKVPETAPLAPLPLYVAGAVLSLLCAAFGWTLPRLMVARVAPQHLALRVAGFAYSRILFAACFEAAGLFWAVLALLLRQPLCLLGPAAALLVMIAHFPTQQRMERAIGMSEEAVDRALGYSD